MPKTADRRLWSCLLYTSLDAEIKAGHYVGGSRLMFWQQGETCLLYTSIRLIPFGSEPLNELIMRCSMMITDYSSAVWDVFYQGKPVVFYLFDLEQYNKVQGSYIDMEKDAFGDVVHTPEKLASVIEEYTVRGFEEKKQYGAMRSELIKYIDDKNSERTYNEMIRRYPCLLYTSRCV